MVRAIYALVDLLRQIFRFFKQRWYLGVVVLVTAAAGACLGLRLTPWLAHSLGVSPLRYSVIPTPSPDFVSGVVKMIESAQAEIIVTAPRIDDEEVLKALQAAETRGRKVLVVLSVDQTSPTSGSLGWLLHYGVGEVYLDKFPFTGVKLIVDSQIALVASLPITVRSKLGGMSGDVLFLRHPDIVADLRKTAISQAERGVRQQVPKTKP